MSYDYYEEDDLAFFRDPSEVETIIQEGKEKLEALYKQEIRNTITEAKEAEERLETAKYDLSKVEREISFKRLELEKVKSEVAESFTKLPKEYIDAFVADVTGGFKPGDIAWVILCKGKHIKCPTCNGKRHIQLLFNGEVRSFECPDCKGRGGEDIYEYYAAQKKIERVDLMLAFDSHGKINWTREPLVLGGDDYGTKVKDVFHTQEEAEAEAKRKTEAELASKPRY